MMVDEKEMEPMEPMDRIMVLTDIIQNLIVLLKESNVRIHMLEAGTIEQQAVIDRLLEKKEA